MTVRDFTLIETLRYAPDETAKAGFPRLHLHLARLARSARRLGFALPAEVMPALEGAVAGTTGPQRVRLELTRDGRLAVVAVPFVPLAPETIWRVAVARTRLSSTDPLLRYKTSRRGAYEAARAERPVTDADEMLLLNEHGQPCEGTITSLFLDDGSGLLKTPPIACGLLAGVLRTELICARRARVERLTLEALERGQLYMGNSLRGLIRAELVGERAAEPACFSNCL